MSRAPVFLCGGAPFSEPLWLSRPLCGDPALFGHRVLEVEPWLLQLEPRREQLWRCLRSTMRCLCFHAPARLSGVVFGPRRSFVSIPTFSGIDFLKLSIGSFNSSFSRAALVLSLLGVAVPLFPHSLAQFWASFWPSLLLRVGSDLFGRRFPKLSIGSCNLSLVTRSGGVLPFCCVASEPVRLVRPGDPFSGIACNFRSVGSSLYD